MGLMPRLFGGAIVALALASGAALADDTARGNDSLISLSTPISSSLQDSLSPADNSFGVLTQKFDIQSSGHLDFFSVQPETSGNLKQLLGGQAAGGGLQLQFKW
jgi:hypothetical protein